MAIRHAMCALALGSASPAYADFSWEIAGSFAEADQAGGLASDVATISATHYFDAVADGNGPLALASFLDPATNVSIVASETDSTAAADAFDQGIETRTYSVAGTYVFPASKWYVGGHYASGERDEPSFLPTSTVTLQFEADETAYGASVGKYFGRGATRLELSLERSQLDSEQLASLCIIGTGCLTAAASAQNTVDRERFEARHVRRFRAATYALTGQVSREDADIEATFTDFAPPGSSPPVLETFDIDLYESDSYGVGAELYPIPTVGVRVGYSRVSGSTVIDQDTVDVGASWFFRRNVGLEVILSRVDSDVVARTEWARLRVIGRLR